MRFNEPFFNIDMPILRTAQFQITKRNWKMNGLSGLWQKINVCFICIRYLHKLIQNRQIIESKRKSHASVVLCHTHTRWTHCEFGRDGNVADDEWSAKESTKNKNRLRYHLEFTCFHMFYFEETFLRWINLFFRSKWNSENNKYQRFNFNSIVQR